MNKRLSDVVINKIIDWNIYGVRVKTLRVYASEKHPFTSKTIINGEFSVEGNIGLYNCLVLLGKLIQEDNIYFAKISFFNISFYIHELDPVGDIPLRILRD